MKDKNLSYKISAKFEFKKTFHILYVEVSLKKALLHIHEASYVDKTLK